jgi:hypothetical protein
MDAAEHSRFEKIVTGAIVANSAVMVWSLVDRNHAELLEGMDSVFLWFFACELASRIRVGRLGFFRNGWNVADSIIIVVALLPVAGGGIAVLRLARLARSVHLLRHVSHLRLTRLLRLARRGEKSMLKHALTRA